MSKSMIKKIGIGSFVILLISVIATVLFLVNASGSHQSISRDDVSRFLEKKYSHHYKLVKLMASDSIVKNGETTDKVGFLNELASSFEEITYAFIVDNLGNLKAYSKIENTSSINPNYFEQFKTEAWFQKTLKDKYLNFFDHGLVGARISKYTIDVVGQKSGHYFSAPFYDTDTRVMGHLIYFVDINRFDKELQILGIDISKSFVTQENGISVKNSITDELGVYFSINSPINILEKPILYASIVSFASLFLFGFILFKGFDQDGDGGDENWELHRKLREANDKISTLESIANKAKLSTGNDLQKLKELEQGYEKYVAQVKSKEKILKMLNSQNLNTKNEIHSRIESLLLKEEELKTSINQLLEHEQALSQDFNKVKFQLTEVFQYFFKLVKLKKNIQVEIMNANLMVQRNEVDPKMSDLINNFQMKLDELSLLGVKSFSILKNIDETKMLNTKSALEIVKNIENKIEMNNQQKDNVLKNLKSLSNRLDDIENLSFELENKDEDNLIFMPNEPKDFSKVS